MTEQQIKEKIEAVFENKSCYLFEIKLRGSKNIPVIEVFADTEEGITLKECGQLNREIAEDLDESGLVKYRLDISSPGIDREFKFSWQYKRNIGKNLMVEYVEGEEIRKVEGVLEEVGYTGINLNVSKEINKISFNNIKTAKVKIKWS